MALLASVLPPAVAVAQDAAVSVVAQQAPGPVVDMSADGIYATTGRHDGVVDVWDLRIDRRIAEFRLKSGAGIEGIQWDDRGRCIRGNTGWSLFTIDLDKRTVDEVEVLWPRENEARSGLVWESFSNAGNARARSVCDAGTFTVTLRVGEKESSFQTKLHSWTGFDPTGRRLLVVERGAIQVVDVATATEAFRWELGAERLVQHDDRRAYRWSIVFEPDGERVGLVRELAGGDQVFEVRSLRDGATLTRSTCWVRGGKSELAGLPRALLRGGERVLVPEPDNRTLGLGGFTAYRMQNLRTRAIEGPRVARAQGGSYTPMLCCAQLPAPGADLLALETPEGIELWSLKAGATANRLFGTTDRAGRHLSPALLDRATQELWVPREDSGAMDRWRLREGVIESVEWPRMWGAYEHRSRKTWRVHNGLALSTTDRDGDTDSDTLVVWRLEDGQVHASAHWPGLTELVDSGKFGESMIAWCEPASRIAVASRSELRVFSWPDLRLLATIRRPAPKGEEESMLTNLETVLSPDGSVAVLVTGAGRLECYDIGARACVQSMRPAWGRWDMNADDDNAAPEFASLIESVLVRNDGLLFLAIRDRDAGVSGLWSFDPRSGDRKRLAGDAVDDLAWSPNGDSFWCGTFQQHSLLFPADGSAPKTLVHRLTFGEPVFLDEQHLFLLNSYGSDGRHAELVSLESGRTVVTGWGGDADAHLWITPQGSYSGSRAGLQLVAFETALQGVTLEQVDATYNRPDVVIRSFPGHSPVAVADAARAVRRRWGLLGVENGDRPGSLRPPQIRFVGSTPRVSEESSVRCAIEVRKGSPAVAAFEVRVGGVLVSRVRQAVAEGERSTLQIDLPPGESLVRVVAMSDDGQRSPPLAFRCRCIGAPKPVDVYYLGVGVSDYPDEAQRLKYAADDVTVAAEALQRLWRGDVHVKLLCDGDATRQEIQAAGAFFRRARPGDLVILHLAGHGVLDARRDYRFANVDIDWDDPQATGTSFEDLLEGFENCASANRVVLMDTCHAGEFDARAEPVRIEAADLADSVVVAHGDVAKKRGPEREEERAETKKVASAFERGLVDLRRESGATVIAAAGAAEYALESDTWKHGVFTHAVLEALVDKKADTDLDGQVLISELSRYVSQRVVALTGGRQKPMLRRENFEVDSVMLKAMPAQVVAIEGMSAPGLLSTAGAGRDFVVKSWNGLTRIDGASGRQVWHLDPIGDDWGSRWECRMIGEYVLIGPGEIEILAGHDRSRIVTPFHGPESLAGSVCAPWMAWCVGDSGIVRQLDLQRPGVPAADFSLSAIVTRVHGPDAKISILSRADEQDMPLRVGHYEMPLAQGAEPTAQVALRNASDLGSLDDWSLWLSQRGGFLVGLRKVWDQPRELRAWNLTDGSFLGGQTVSDERLLVSTPEGVVTFEGRGARGRSDTGVRVIDAATMSDLPAIPECRTLVTIDPNHVAAVLVGRKSFRVLDLRMGRERLWGRAGEDIHAMIYDPRQSALVAIDVNSRLHRWSLDDVVGR